MKSKGPLWLISVGFEVLNAQVMLRSVSKNVFVRVEGSPKVSNKGKIIIGKGTLIRSTISRIEIATERNAFLRIGNDVRINYGCSIGCTKHIEIGSYTRIGPYCTIMDSNFHDEYMRNVRPEGKEVKIGKNVLIGTKSIILKDVSIGDGTIIGAGSVVTKDLPPYVIAAGNPAKVIRNLDPTQFRSAWKNV